jgi:hypothetical protein
VSNRRKLRRLPLPKLPFASGGWNGEPAGVRRCRVIVGDAPQFPEYWARDLIGTERDAVHVVYGGREFYLDNADGSGWDKVMNGGGPGRPHRDLAVQREVITSA